MPFNFSIPTMEVDRLKLTFEDTTDFFWPCSHLPPAGAG